MSISVESYWEPGTVSGAGDEIWNFNGLMPEIVARSLFEEDRLIVS